MREALEQTRTWKQTPEPFCAVDLVCAAQGAELHQQIHAKSAGEAPERTVRHSETTGKCLCATLAEGRLAPVATRREIACWVCYLSMFAFCFHLCRLQATELYTTADGPLFRSIMSVMKFAVTQERLQQSLTVLAWTNLNCMSHLHCVWYRQA